MLKDNNPAQAAAPPQRNMMNMFHHAKGESDVGSEDISELSNAVQVPSKSTKPAGISTGGQ